MSRVLFSGPRGSSWRQVERDSVLLVEECDRCVSIAYQQRDVVVLFVEAVSTVRDIVVATAAHLGMADDTAASALCLCVADDGLELYEHAVFSECPEVRAARPLELRRRPADAFRACVVVQPPAPASAQVWRGFLRGSMTASEAVLLCCVHTSPEAMHVFNPLRGAWLIGSMRLDQQGVMLPATATQSLVMLEIRRRPTAVSHVAVLSEPLRAWNVAGTAHGAAKVISVVGWPSTRGRQVVEACRPGAAAAGAECSLVSSTSMQFINQDEPIEDDAGVSLLVKGQAEDQEAILEAAALAFGSTNHYELLPGEIACHKLQNVTHWVPQVGKVLGTLILTTFRIIFVPHDRSTYSDAVSNMTSIPLRLIYKMSRIESGVALSFIEINCRNFEAYIFAFLPQKHSRSLVMDFVQAQQSELPFALQAPIPANPPVRELDWCLEQYKRVFGDSLYIPNFDGLAQDEAPSASSATTTTSSSNSYLFRVWENKDYSVCTTYPRFIVVPNSITDQQVVSASEFRSKNRCLAVVWRHPDGPTITRCSQPMVGMGKKRNSDDEAIVSAIRAAGGGGTVCLIDSRPLANAVANKLVGAGSESVSSYENCDIKFIGLANIHAVRDSWHKMRALCQSRGVDPNYASQQGESWFLSLHAAEWLQHVQHVLDGAVTMARVVDREKRSCITHCSDGWDRTSQLTSLAQLMLDPYYRTLEGFPRLIHKEWLSFGHRFDTRSGAGATPQEREMAPVFLLFLDCVYQLTRQFYSAFEFCSEYLVVLLDTSYSGQFGTFLFDCERERVEHNVFERSRSVWDYLEGRWHELRNPHYRVNEIVQLFPSTNLAHLALWNRVFLRTSFESDYERDRNFLKVLNAKKQ